jgi:3-hydroxyacyl-[acyl-carrier-protein] dehydratase
MSGTLPEPGTSLPDMGYADVMLVLPHRYPMLMVDRVTDLVAHRSAVGIKNVTFNEPFFQGHFPGDPIMPGVLIIEAMGQAAAVLMVASLGTDPRGKSVYFMSVDEGRFRRPVRPGDELRLAVKLQKAKLGVWRFEGRASVAGQHAAEAVFSARLVER